MTAVKPTGERSDGEAMARLFHDTYERMAPDFGYETRPDTKQFDPLSKNGRLMIAVCAAVTDTFATAHAALVAELEVERNHRRALVQGQNERYQEIDALTSRCAELERESMCNFNEAVRNREAELELRAKLQAAERDAAKGRELWAYLREYGDAWGEYQDDFVKMGLLELVDMSNASEDDRCANCEGDCDVCYRTSGILMDAALAQSAKGAG